MAYNTFMEHDWVVIFYHRKWLLLPRTAGAPMQRNSVTQCAERNGQETYKRIKKDHLQNDFITEQESAASSLNSRWRLALKGCQIIRNNLRIIVEYCKTRINRTGFSKESYLKIYKFKVEAENCIIRTLLSVAWW